MKFLKKCFIFIILLFNFSHLKGNLPVFQIDNSREYEVLEKLFRMGTTDEEYGYVLEGTKPISTRNFYHPALVPLTANLSHTENEILKSFLIFEAIPILKKMSPYQKNFILKIVPLSLIGSPDLGVEVQFINIPKLQEVIEQNITLFQYILGPTTEIKELVNRIAYSEETLSDILMENSVLIGLVLGFGSHNSLLGGREEVLNSLSCDKAPFASKGQLMDELKQYYGWHYLNVAGGEDGLMGFRTDYTPLSPLGRCLTIQEELTAIQQRHEPLPNCLMDQPRFLFGAYQGGPSNEKLFMDLKRSQKNIQDLLQKEDFLAFILTKILGTPPHIMCVKPLHTPLNPSFFREKINLENWKQILFKTSQYFDTNEQKIAFFQAVFNATSQPSIPNRIGISEKTLKGLKTTLNNLSLTQDFFQKLSQDSSLQTVVPNQLYFKTIQTGSEKELNHFDRVCLSYMITDLNRQTLSANHSCWLSIAQLIPGLAHGLQGMHIGEKREIYIHPALAYGILTTLPPGMGLIANVHLLNIDYKTICPLAPLKALDCDWIQNPSLLKEMEDSIQKKPSFVGWFYHQLITKIEGDKAPIVLSSLQKMHFQNFLQDHHNQ